jgi:hypothetical protein
MQRQLPSKNLYLHSLFAISAANLYFVTTSLELKSNSFFSSSFSESDILSLFPHRLLVVSEERLYPVSNGGFSQVSCSSLAELRWRPTPLEVGCDLATFFYDNAR